MIQNHCISVADQIIRKNNPSGARRLDLVTNTRFDANALIDDISITFMEISDNFSFYGPYKIILGMIGIQNYF